MEWNRNGENIKEAALNFLTWDSPIGQKHGSTYPTYQKIWKKRPNIGNMQHFRNATSGRFFVDMWLNNCERKLPFATVSLEVIAGYKCSSEFTFEQEKQFFVNSSSSFHSMIK